MVERVEALRAPERSNVSESYAFIGSYSLYKLNYALPIEFDRRHHWTRMHLQVIISLPAPSPAGKRSSRSISLWLVYLA